jgi:hypothetical protein
MRSNSCSTEKRPPAQNRIRDGRGPFQPETSNNQQNQQTNKLDKAENGSQDGEFAAAVVFGLLLNGVKIPVLARPGC